MATIDPLSSLPQPTPAPPEGPRDEEQPLSRTSRLTLARKLAAIGSIFLAVALLTVGLSMWGT